VEAESQAVRIEAVGGSGDTVSVFVDGTFAQELSPPYRWYFPLRTGMHTIEFTDQLSSSSVRIEVK